METSYFWLHRDYLKLLLGRWQDDGGDFMSAEFLEGDAVQGKIFLSSPQFFKTYCFSHFLYSSLEYCHNNNLVP